VAGFTVFSWVCGQCLRCAKKMGHRFKHRRPISRVVLAVAGYFARLFCKTILQDYFSVKVSATGALMVGANVRVVGKFGGVTAPFMKRLS
jgi:hypothetical protein